MAHTESTWIPSKYNIVTELVESRTAVLNTRSGAIVMMDKKEFDRLFVTDKGIIIGPTSEEQDSLNKLIKNGFLVAKDVDETSILELQVQEAKFRNDWVSYTIAPTLACNLWCDYCFESHLEEKSKGSMSKSVQNDLLKYILLSSTDKRKVHINWFGGEPLVANKTIHDLITALGPYFEKKNIDFESSMNTNGTKIVDCLELLRELRLKTMQVTIDIPFSSKVGKLEDYSIDKVFDGICVASKYCKDVILRINIVEDNEQEFKELWDRLSSDSMKASIGCVVFIEMFRPKPRAGDRGPFFPISQAQYKAIVDRETENAFNIGIDIKERWLTPIPVCEACRVNNFVVDPKGNLYRCINDIGDVRYSYGHVSDSGINKPSEYYKWLLFDPTKIKECRACIYLPLCLGGCAHKRFQVRSNKEANTICPYEFKFGINDQLLRLIKKMANKTLSAGREKTRAAEAQRYPLWRDLLATKEVSDACRTGMKLGY